jgi:hypothetical protein
MSGTAKESREDMNHQGAKTPSEPSLNDMDRLTSCTVNAGFRVQLDREIQERIQRFAW